MDKRRLLLIPITFLLLIQAVNAAPSGSIDQPVGTIADNVLVLGGEEDVTVAFRNSAGADVSDVASTIQYITLSAANLNPTRTIIDTTDAYWEIYRPDSTIRASGTVPVSLETNAIYSPYSTSQTVYMYTWSLGKPSESLEAYTSSGQFSDGLKILRPGETVKLKVKVKCQNKVGDTRIWFFFRATEAEYQSVSYPTDIGSIPLNMRANLYYSKLPGPDQTKYWLPLHNSYDPYDQDIVTGHNFDQNSWNRGLTIHAFAKGSKLIHQKPEEDPEEPEEPSYSLHICGEKFEDSNRNGVYDVEVEHGIGLLIGGSWVEPGVTFILLGPDMKTKATEYYTELSYPPPEDEHPDILQSGENGLRGSYCFNLVGAIEGKTYTFYIKEEVPAGREATTATLIGPITLIANSEGPRESINNHFGNTAPITPKPVGGVYIPVNKLTLLMPYLVFLGLISTFILIAIRSRNN